MATITLTNIPEDLLCKLQKKALLEKSDIQEQIIKILEQHIENVANLKNALDDFYKEFPIEENEENEERYDFSPLRSRDFGRDIDL